MNRFITGKVVKELSDITGNEILVLDAYAIFDGLDIIELNKPIAAIAEDKYIFSHIYSFLQMLNVPLFFVHQTTLEEICRYKSLTIDILNNTVGETIDEQQQLPILDTKITYGNEPISVFSSFKGMNIQDCFNYGADGIGLISTEFVFYEYKNQITKEFQYATFDRYFMSHPSSEYTIRLFDIASDKIPIWCRSMWNEHEKKKQGGRLLFSKVFSECLVQQIKAIVKLSKKYSLSLLIPYFTNSNEIEMVKSIIQKHDNDCAIKLGVMIETVAAINDMQSIIDIVDFFSVGSNDLVQSYFGINRTNIEDHLDRISLNAAFWKTLGNIVDNANGKQVRICGQLPIAPKAIQHLIKLGYRSFTVHPIYIQYLKNTIGSIVVNCN